MISTEPLLQLLMAVLLGGLIGYERQQKHKSAGLRTHVLVCLASAGIMIAAEQYYGIGHAELSRFAQAIVTGIGFLGAGTILSKKGHVLGLTTAASVWAIAGVGIVIGLRQYALATGITVLALFFLRNKSLDFAAR
ncbi:MAG TPA: MgtC/SapB family protein [Candidatus Nanoarchaeia archaeon]|nr:MgtC/SapB family protein [Candidatus Nanoarchaeia archaeon]